MSRVLVVFGIIGILGLAACGARPGSQPGSGQSPATAEINSAYPTAQASVSNSSQTVGGYSVDLKRAWRDGKQVHADLCFTLPDASDWTIWNARLEYGGQSNAEFSSQMISRQEPAAGKPGQRCDEMGFYVAPDTDLSTASLVIDSLGAYPSQEEYCDLYMPKIQQALNERGAGITLACNSKNGQLAMQITGKPASMSQEQAEQMVYSDEFYTVKGPWSFPIQFGH